MKNLDLTTLTDAVSGTAAAFRSRTDYQPIGGKGDKVFPPTYEGGKYAVETRINHETDEEQPCVLLDSVQSQANRMEQALLDAYNDGQLELPILVAKFDHEILLKKFTVTSLDAPHRIADAIFRDCTLDGVIFRQSETGRILDTADIRNATELFATCPTALIFGLWDSTGPRGGLGTKFQRAIVSEIVGYNAILGVRTSSRIDPAQILKEGVTLYRRAKQDNDTPTWTLDPDKATKGKKNKIGNEGKPSEANHGNVVPSIKDGGFTISRATQTTTVSLSVLRRLHFPLDGAAESSRNTNLIARTTLAALGLAAGTLARLDGNLRSRCDLFAEQDTAWELLDKPNEPPQTFHITPDQSLTLLRESVTAAKKAGLPWFGEIQLRPSDELVELVRRSQVTASTPTATAD